MALGLQLVLAGFLLRGPRRAKVTEGVATIGLLLDFIWVGVMAW